MEWNGWRWRWTDGQGTFQSRFLNPDDVVRTCREGGNFEVCDCRRRRRRRLVMNLTSRLEFISVTRRGARVGIGGRALEPPPPRTPSVPQTGPPISWM